MTTSDICNIVAAIAIVLMCTTLIYFAYKADVRSRTEHTLFMESMKQIQGTFDAQQRTTLAPGMDLHMDADTGCAVWPNNGCSDCREPDCRYLFTPPPVN